jgi:hypothetical protein
MAALRRLAAPQPPELLRVEVLARQSQVVEQPGLSRVRALQQVQLRAVQAASAAPHPRCRAPLAPHLRPA